MEKTEEKGVIARVYNWFKNLTVRGLLRAILIIFVIIVILLSVSYLPRLMSGLSSSLSAALYSIFVPAENATMTGDKSIMNSGEDFIVTFKRGDQKNAGLFTVSYACSGGTELLSVEKNGLKRMSCDAPYYLLDNETQIRLRPVTDESLVRLAIEGAFENNDDQKIEKVGVVRITVKNDSVGHVSENVPVRATSTAVIRPATGNTGSQTSNNYYANTGANYSGRPDLAVRILQTGLLSNIGSVNTYQNQFSYGDTVGVKFEIRNDGDAVTGPWSFSAALPSLTTPVYNSNTQISLRPGESIVFTLGFSNLSNQNTGLITINADPQNMVGESIEYNNLATVTIANLSYNTNYYNNNNNYNAGCYVNGYFTYNCGNYYNNDDYLTVSCYATPDDPETGDRVRWHAEVFGGDGDYDFDWTGTNSLNSSVQNPTKTYSSRGTKRAEVTVTDGDDNEASATCSVFVD